MAAAPDRPHRHPSGAPALVGREREWATLGEALAAALAGHGGLVLIGGEAGIGKTTLAERALAEAQQRGAMVLVGRCYDLSETPPYGPWAEALARVPDGDDRLAAPDLAGGAGATSQAALFAAVRGWFATVAAARPLVILLDDLHWADPASLDLLRFLGRAVTDLPLLLLPTYRSDELTRRHPLYTLLPLLVREARAARLDLRPLDAAGLAALVAPYALPDADAGRLVAYLAGRAEGNPFFAGELLRALEEEGTLQRDGAGWALGDLAAAGMPPLLRQVLDARLDRLGEDARELLAVAAVIGQEVPFALWQAVAGADEGALLGAVQPATAAHLLADLPDGSGARFAHALVREALYEGTPALRRRALHRRAGEVLATVPHPDPDAVAHHFQRAGDDRALAWLVRAGDQAFRAYALASADARYEAALALLDRSDATPAERGWLLLRLVARLRTADPARAFAHLEEARPAIAAAADPLLDACALLLAGLIRCWLLQARRGLDEMAAGFAQLAALRAAQPGATLAVPRCVRDALGDSGGSLALEQAGAGRYDDALALPAYPESVVAW
jgi:predicted ATPase